MMFLKLTHRFLIFLSFGFVIGGFVVASAAMAEALQFVLPTENEALLRGGGPQFYMYTNRSFEGRRSQPWEGGTYGFSRNPKRVSAGLRMTRFHEGIDIKPLRRDASGEPLDDIQAAADGRVAHVNAVEKHSNYGKYIVLEHESGGCRYYTFYAHLARPFVRKGEQVKAGEAIARMGYTGRGLDRARAHLHFEICLMLSPEFDLWHDRYYPKDTNWHGNYNGINLAGLDPARFYLARRKDPGLTIPEFLESEKPAYRLRLPLKYRPHLLSAYPWLVTGKPGPGDRSWEITFAQGDVPLKISPSATAAGGPEVAWIDNSRGLPAHYLTRSKVGWEKDRGYYLNNTGLGFVDLITEGMMVYVEK